MKLITNRDPGYSRSRTRQTIDFCSDIPAGSSVLDIAARNALSQQLASEMKVEVINTHSDLDNLISPDKDYKWHYVTCFEVIEHLLNPRKFFDNLHEITEENVRVFLSYPSRPKCMWNDDEHFHEYDSLRFKFLLQKTNWKIVRKKKIYVPRMPFGIRPLLRNFIPQTIIFELVKISDEK